MSRVADATINQFDQLEYIGAVIDLTAASKRKKNTQKRRKYRDLIELSGFDLCVTRQAYCFDESGRLAS